MRPIAALALALLAAAALPQAQAKAGAPKIYEVGVDYEFGDIRELVMGIPYLYLPSANEKSFQVFVESVNKFMPPERQITREMYQFFASKDSYHLIFPDNDCNPDDHESGPGKKPCKGWLAKEETDYFIKKIKEIVPDVIIHQPSQVTFEQASATLGPEWMADVAGVNQVFARDDFITVGNTVIEVTPGAANRRADILGLRKLLDTRLAGVKRVQHVSMPPADISAMLKQLPGGNWTWDKTDVLTLEGGDVIAYGYRVFVGVSANSGVGTSAKGAAWLAQALGKDYTVEAVPLRDFMLHLDVALSIPRRDTVIYAEDCFANGVPAFFKKFKNQIKMTVEEASYLAVNGMPINEKHYFVATNDEFNATSASYLKLEGALKRAGVTVTPIPYKYHTEDGGALRCSYQPLKRALKANDACKKACPK